MNNKRVLGYTRVSSQEQNLDQQILALKVFVSLKNILMDKQSVKDLDIEINKISKKKWNGSKIKI